MNKANLNNFINKYHLNGLCTQVKVISKSNALITSFQTEDKAIMGMIKVNDIGLPDDEFGVFNTPSLQRILGAMHGEVSAELMFENGMISSLELRDDSFTSRILLADLSIIPIVTPIKNVPPVDATITITPSFIDRFNKAKGALADAEQMAFVSGKDGLQLILNYAEHNTDTITINFDTVEITNEIPILRFNANFFHAIINANKDCSLGTIQLSEAGLMTINFRSETFQTKYLLVMLQ